MAIRSGSSTVGCSRQIVFEERHDLWWLRGTNLKDFRRLTGLRCDGEAAGMDIGTVYAWADQLAQQRVTVVLARGKHLTSIACVHQTHHKPVASSPVFLDAALLMDDAERASVTHKLHLTPTHLTSLVGNDLGRVYVYQVCDGIYEIDWELTKLSRSSVEVLVIASYQQHRKVSCRLVQPKPQRSSHRPPQDTQGAGNALGQLSLL